MKKASLFLTIVFMGFSIKAQESEVLSPIIFIYDASGSMWAKMQNKTKKEIAAEALSSAVSNMPDDQKIGLVAYGHRDKTDCRDVELLVDMESGNKSMVMEAIKKINPLGKTPLAYSAELVIDKIRASGNKATVILITDGIESCDGNICNNIKKAKNDGVDFKLHIVGFGLKSEETAQLICAAKAGGGQYYDAADAGILGAVLNEAATTTVDDPPNNFSVYTSKNGQPVDAYVKALQAGTKNAVENKRTYRDTVSFYLPAGKYDLVIFPLENSNVEGVTISGVESFEGKMTFQPVSFDGGKIIVSTFNNDVGCDAVVKIFSNETGKVAAHGRTYGRPNEQEVNPGSYKIQLEALGGIMGLDKQKIFENVIVVAGTTTELSHTFKTGIAMIGAKSASELIDASVTIKEVNTKKNIDGKRTYTSESSNPRKFILNPATYEITVAALGDHSGKRETFTIEVKEGETIEKIITF